MSAAAERLARLFVAPAPGDAAAPSIDVALPPAVAVVGRDRRAIASGCAVALVLARRRRASAALVCVRGAGARAGWRGTPVPGARRLASVVGAGAVAAGRLVLVTLDGDADEAVARAEQAMGKAGDAPTVLILAGAREARFDRLLDAQDAVGVACGPGDPPALADLALAGLPATAVALAAHVARPAAALAAAGVGVTPSLAAVVAPLVQALG